MIRVQRNGLLQPIKPLVKHTGRNFLEMADIAILSVEGILGRLMTLIVGKGIILGVHD